MNTTGSALALLAVLLAAAPATAQYEDDSRYGPLIETLAEGAARPPGTYVVASGDTLWGLSDRAFGDGFYWPTLWSYNPQVTNPHWIYPGDLIYLEPRLKAHSDRRVTYAKSRFTDAPRLEEVLARYKGFVTERAYRESGQIQASREERMLLGEYDEAYLKFSIPKRILPGEEFTIYRPVKELIHPVTGKRLGHLIQHLGIVRVLTVDRTKPMVKSLILTAYEEIKRGDLVTKRVWDKENIVPVENRVGLWSRTLTTFRDQSLTGEHHYVVIDKGFRQKLRRGNRLIVRWRGDGLGRTTAAQSKKYPWENHGEVMVIEPFENTSLAIVLRSIRELKMGEILEMVRGY